MYSNLLCFTQHQELLEISHSWTYHLKSVVTQLIEVKGGDAFWKRSLVAGSMEGEQRAILWPERGSTAVLVESDIMGRIVTDSVWQVFGPSPYQGLDPWSLISSTFHFLTPRTSGLGVVDSHSTGLDPRSLISSTFRFSSPGHQG